MKKIAVLAAMVMAVALAQPAKAADACTSLLCMAGAADGVGVADGCGQAVADYFAITQTQTRSYGCGQGRTCSRRVYSPTKTQSARAAFLQSCPVNNAPEAATYISKISQEYGRTQLPPLDLREGINNQLQP